MQEMYGYNVMTYNYKGERFCYENFMSRDGYSKAVESLRQYQKIKSDKGDNTEIWIEHMTRTPDGRTIKTVIKEEEIQKRTETENNIGCALMLVGVVIAGIFIACDLWQVAAVLFGGIAFVYWLLH
jgi:hypothetical protein